MVKVVVHNENDVETYSKDFEAQLLARFSRKGKDEQARNVKNPSAVFQLKVDCSSDIIDMVLNWMLRNKLKDQSNTWKRLEPPGLNIQRKAKLYQIAIYHFKVIHEAEIVRKDLVAAIEQQVLTAGDYEALKLTLAEDSNLRFRIDVATV